MSGTSQEPWRSKGVSISQHWPQKRVTKLHTKSYYIFKRQRTHKTISIKSFINYHEYETF